MPTLQLRPLALPRPPSGPRFGELTAWTGNGGPSRGHPARAMPFSFEVPLPDDATLRRLHLVGVFARFAGLEHEASGALGAILTLEQGGSVAMRLELVNGRRAGASGRLHEPLAVSPPRSRDARLPWLPAKPAPGRLP